MKHDFHETDSPTQIGPDSPAADPAPGERRPVLVALGGELLATPIPLERAKVTLGRALDADVRLNDAKASRLHACITTEVNPESSGPTFRITDLHSTNGTLVNGRAISEAILHHGTRFSSAISFFVLNSSTRSIVRFNKRFSVCSVTMNLPDC